MFIFFLIKTTHTNQWKVVYVALGSRAMVPGLVVIFGKWVKGMLLQKSRDETMAPRTTKSNLRVACEPPPFFSALFKTPSVPIWCTTYR